MSEAFEYAAQVQAIEDEKLRRAGWLADIENSLRELRSGVLRLVGENSEEYGWCTNIKAVSRNSRLPYGVARAVLRDLRDTGHVEYVRGLFSEDGEVAGSGYCLTPAGLKAFRALPPFYRLPNTTQTTTVEKRGDA